MNNEDVTHIEIYNKLERHDEEIHEINLKLDPISDAINAMKNIFKAIVGAGGIAIAFTAIFELFSRFGA